MKKQLLLFWVGVFMLTFAPVKAYEYVNLDSAFINYNWRINNCWDWIDYKGMNIQMRPAPMQPCTYNIDTNGNVFLTKTGLYIWLDNKLYQEGKALSNIYLYFSNSDSMWLELRLVGKYGFDTVIIDSTSMSIGILSMYNFDNKFIKEIYINSPKVIIDNIMLEFNPAKLFYPERNTEFCTNAMINFGYNSNMPGDRNYWIFDDGTKAYGNRTQKSFSTEGTHTVMFITQDQNMMIDTIIQQYTITNTAKPIVHFWAQLSACPNDPISFNVNDNNFASYAWNFGDGSPISNMPNPKYAYSDTGTYKVVLTVINSCGQVAKDSNYAYIRNDVNVWPGFNFNPSNNDGFCPKSIIRFNSEYTGGKYEWNFGDGGTSTLANPYNIYNDTGTYKVHYKVTNGCGRSDTMSKFIHITYENWRQPNWPNIRFDMDDMENQDYLEICPGMDIDFRLDNIDMNQPLTFTWNFGDGSPEVTGINPKHIFTNPGNYYITVNVKNNCQGTSNNNNTLLVNVNPTLIPPQNIMILPDKICPGEKVFFVNNDWDDKNKLFFDIDFGDGSPILQNISKNTDTIIDVLASHTYPTEGTYQAKVIMKNYCNVKDSVMRMISVLNDTNNIPFYYVGNSTTKKDGPPMPTKQDWSKRKNVSDHEMKIPIQWPGYQSSYNDTVIIAFWYGSADFITGGGNPGEPNGIVYFISPNLATGDTIKAYIPKNYLAPPTVGFVAAWFCKGMDSLQLDQEPDLFGVPVDTASNPITSFPFNDAGFSKTPIVVIDPMNEFTGNCNATIKNSQWTYKSAVNEDAYLFLYDNWYEIKTFLNGQTNCHDNNSCRHISSGNYEISGDTITFIDEQTCGYFGLEGIYTINMLTDSTMTLVCVGSQYGLGMQDGCQQRLQFLTNTTFKRKKGPMDENNNDDRNRTACPGDPVSISVIEADTYDIYFGDGQKKLNQTAVSQTHSYTTSGDFKAKIIATNKCGRKDTLFTTVTVRNNNLPKADFGTESISFMRGDTIQFRTYGDYGGKDIDPNSYSWSFGDGTTSTQKDPKHVFNSNGNFVVRLTVTNGCGSTTAIRGYSIKSLTDFCDMEAKFSFTVNNDSLKVRFNNQAWGNFTNVFWDFGDGSTSNQLSPSRIFPKAGKYMACMSIYDSVTKCSNQRCQEITVGTINCLADFDFVTNNTTNTVTFANTSVNTNKYFWTFDDGTSDTVANPKHTFSVPGIYQVCLSANNTINKCFSQKCENIQVGEMDSASCIADFTFIADAATLTVNFYEAVQGQITGGQWNMGDGTYRYEPNPVHTYAQPGVYNVCATVYNSNNGCQSQKCKEVTLGNTNCKADFNYVIDPATNNVSFSENCINATHFYWDFGDGAWDDTTVTEHTYAEAGTYNTCLMIYNDTNDCMAKKCYDIQINALNTKTLAAAYTYFINQSTNTVTFSDKSTGTPTSWYWTFGDGSYQAQQNPTKTYTNPGLYPVCLYVFEGSTGKTSQKCQDIAVGIPSCNIKAQFTSFINNTTKEVTFTDRSIGTVNKWFWNFGDGTTSSQRSPKKTFSDAGFYLVSLAINDTVNKCTDYYASFLQVGTADCKADFSYTVDAATKTVSFDEKSSSNVSNFFWLFGDGTFSLQQEPSHIYQRDDMYNVSLTVTTNSGICMDFVEKKVQVGQVDCDADFQVYVDDQTNTAYFTNKVLGATTNLYWIFGDGTISNAVNPTHTFPAPGYYTVVLNTFDPNNGCMDKEEKKVLISGLGSDCEADFIYIVDSLTVNFTNKSTGTFTSYYWNFGEKDKNSTASSPQGIIYSKPGYYNVCLTAKGTTCENITCKYIKVGGTKEKACFADFVHNIIDSASKKVAFYDKSYGNMTGWTWDFGDGTKATTQNPQHTYSSANKFVVRLIAYNTAENCESYTYGLVDLTGIPGIKASFGSKPGDTNNLKASGYPVDFVGIAHGDAAKLKWSFGDGSYDSTTLTPTHLYAAPGSYEVCLTIEDPITGQSNTECDTVRVGLGSTIKYVIGEAPKATLSNYPNPFNAFTYIDYSIERASMVELSVYKMDGTKAITLINTRKDAGSYKLLWDGGNLPAGVYYLQLRSADAIITNKMIIEK